MIFRQITFLWSDIMIWLVVVLCVLSIYLNAKSLRWQSGLQKILMSYRGILSLSVLVIYCTIGILDSIHLKQGNELGSLLDRIISPVGQRTEKTYSAPLSLSLYDEAQSRLNHIDSAITNENDKWLDIDRKMTGAFLYTVFYWIIIMTVLLMLDSLWNKMHPHHEHLLRHYSKLEKQRRWIFFSFVSFILILCVTCCLEISQHYYLLGTNKIGQDVFYLVLKSIRTGLLIGVLTTLISLPFAITFGMLSGYFMGWVDRCIQFVYTTISSIPGILLISATVLVGGLYIQEHHDLFPNSVFRADARLILLCTVMGLSSWTSLCRLIRAEVLKIKTMGFIDSARVMGISTWRILGYHILVNVMHLVLIVSVLDFSGLVLAEAILSYVGVGVDPITPSFGNLLNQASGELARQPIVWWSLFACFTCLFGLVLFANVLADLIRESFDPRLQQ